MPEHESGHLESLPFHVVDETWGTSVAAHLLHTHISLLRPELEIDDCWLGTDLALYLRHRRGEAKLGVRFGRLGIDATTETPPVDSAQEGVYLYHSLYDTPPDMKFTDRLGHDWWGDDPLDGDWAGAVEGERIRTFDAA